MTALGARESWEGDTGSHVFTFTNTDHAVLEITRVRSRSGPVTAAEPGDREK